jgi:FAD binding domain
LLAAELALAGIDVAIVERRAPQDLPGTRAGGLHARTIEVLDQRGVADRFISEGQVAQVAGFAGVTLEISDFPTRHPYGLGLWQKLKVTAGVTGALGGGTVAEMAQLVQVLGAVLILAAYAAAQFGVWDQRSRLYLLLNLVGSAVLTVLIGLRLQGSRERIGESRLNPQMAQ